SLIVRSDADCTPLHSSQSLFDTCSLAVNADPAVIGGAAFGRLNVEHTTALDALVWRARADGDVAVCAAGGLEGEWLARCQTDAANPSYAMVDGTVQVSIRSPG